MTIARAVEPGAQGILGGWTGAKFFLMLETEPEICVPVPLT